MIRSIALIPLHYIRKYIRPENNTKLEVGGNSQLDSLFKPKFKNMPTHQHL